MQLDAATPAQRAEALQAAQRRITWAGVAGAPGFIALAFYLMGRFAEPLHPALGTPMAMNALGTVAIAFIGLELSLFLSGVRRKMAIKAAQERWGD